MADPLLAVRNLVTEFDTAAGHVAAVDDISFDIKPGSIMGLVGESGSGKSVTALSLMRLIATPPGNIAGGEIWFEGKDVLKLSMPDLRALRGDRMSMIFQEPMTSLNPLHRVGQQIAEPIIVHRGLAKSDAQKQAVALLRRVGIPDPETRANAYPHELSGGMRQRVMIAMALACNPRLLIADEPTTALDVTIQAQILDLLKDLQAETGMAILLITHDLGIVAEFADHVAVMYAGKLVERAPVAELFARPRHPYTEGLLRSMPEVDRDMDRLVTIEGNVPDLGALPSGCRFAPRCTFVMEACRQAEPGLRRFGIDHVAACIRDG